VNDLEAGVEIGDFRIIRRLGAGGMGVVYVARQISLDRLVALKVLGAALTHPSDIIRFKREAMAAARLHHPNIATIHYVGQDENGCYMALEYIDGVSLRELVTRLGISHDPHLSIKTILHRGSVRESRPPRIRFDEATTEPATGQAEPAAERDGRAAALEAVTPEAQHVIASGDYVKHVCEIIRDAALALDHAHRQHVVHRDIKPQNIMLDQDGVVKVIDFGVARFFDDATITQQGQLVGTPMYMSPEQVAGHAVDGRSDIYSLGLVMYEMLTLRRPLLAPTREAILRGVVTKALVPVSWKNPGVPRSIESVVHKALAKDPDDRYHSAAEFADDLQHCLDKEPVTAEPYRYKFDTREIVAERPWAITAVAMWWFFSAFYFVCITWVQELARQYLYAQPGWLGYAWASVPHLAAATACTCLGIALMSGRRWARWVSVPAAVAVIGYSIRVLGGYVAVYLTDKPLKMKVGMLTATTGWIMPLLLTIVGGVLVLFVLLLQRMPSRWFEHSRRIRLEQDELITALRSGKPQAPGSVDQQPQQ
jgi:serine/threonine protein kinase